MNLLAIETASEACSVALLCEGRLRERFELAPRRHAELLLDWCDHLLAEAGIARTQVDAIACGVGPGAFTGVRLAVGATQGIALGLHRPVVPVSSLAALAEPFAAEASASGADIIALLDARMDEVYAGAFEATAAGLRARGQERVLSPDAAELAALSARPVIAVGPGWRNYRPRLSQRLGSRVRAEYPEAWPRAAAVARLALPSLDAGNDLRPEQLEPSYLRHKVAQTLEERAGTVGRG